MTIVSLVGWKPGLPTIALTKLIRARTGLGLSATKHCTDRLLDGQIVAIELPSPDAAREFAAAARQIGAVVSNSPPVDTANPTDH
jgi:hypothetical protein